LAVNMTPCSRHTRASEYSERQAVVPLTHTEYSKYDLHRLAASIFSTVDCQLIPTSVLDFGVQYLYVPRRKLHVSSTY